MSSTAGSSDHTTTTMCDPPPPTRRHSSPPTFLSLFHQPPPQFTNLQINDHPSNNDPSQHLTQVHQLNPEVTDFQPQYQGDFWHQFTPGLYYSPYYGISTRPQMDTHTVVIGHGTKSPTSPVQKARQKEMVNICNDGRFLMSVPLKVLVRFSSVAASERPKPNREDQCAASKSTTRPTTENGSEAAANDSDTSKDESSFTQPTEVSPPPADRKRVSGKKVLNLVLKGAQNPSDSALQWSIKWMMDNAEAKEDLLPYAPDVETLNFEQLIDFFQASLVFELRPSPRHISGALMKRLSDEPPTLGMFQALANYVPKDNVVIDRALNSMHDHWCAGRYSDEFLNGFEDLMNAEGNEAFRQRRDHIWTIINKKIARERAAALDVKRKVQKKKKNVKSEGKVEKA